MEQGGSANFRSSLPYADRSGRLVLQRKRRICSRHSAAAISIPRSMPDGGGCQAGTVIRSRHKEPHNKVIRFGDLMMGHTHRSIAGWALIG